MEKQKKKKYVKQKLLVDILMCNRNYYQCNVNNLWPINQCVVNTIGICDFCRDFVNFNFYFEIDEINITYQLEAYSEHSKWKQIDTPSIVVIVIILTNRINELKEILMKYLEKKKEKLPESNFNGYR